MTFRLVLEWLFLFLLIGYAIYTMQVIKNEHKVYLKNARTTFLKQFKFFIPHWWTEVKTDDPNQLSFKRTDSRYTWFALFTWNEHIKSDAQENLIDLFKNHISSRNILFDEDTSIIYNPGDFTEGALITSGRFEMVRLEGTATANAEERLYYDAFLVREKESGSFLYAESRSSVLNGLIEGPYFEAVMNNIELV